MMRNVALAMGAITLALCGAGHAEAQILLDLVNAPSQSNTPYDLTFTAGSSASDVAFAGFQLPSWEYAQDIDLIDTTAGSTNLLGQNWNFTPAGCGSDTSQGDDGFGSGTNGLSFGGTCQGFFDVYDQNIATVAGHHYSLAFLFTESDAVPSEFTVSATNISAATPEPASMLLFGSGLVGVAIAARKRRKSA